MPDEIRSKLLSVGASHVCHLINLSGARYMEQYTKTLAVSVPWDLDPSLKAETIPWHSIAPGNKHPQQCRASAVGVCMHRKPFEVVTGPVLFMRCASLSVKDL